MQADSDAAVGSEGSEQRPTLSRMTWRRGLLGVTLGVLLILCLVPSSRGLLREQIALTVASAPILAWSDQTEQQFLRDTGDQEIAAPPHQNFASENARMRDFAQTHPDDPQIQLASASLDGAGDNLWGGGPFLKLLGTLAQRFPHNPSFAAAYLRDARIEDNRTEDYTLTETPLPTYFHSGSTTSAGELKAFDQAAAHGERIDPHNAFFPFTRLSVLLAAHQDAMAVSTLLRAARKPRWQDYESDEQTGKWRVMQGALGASSALDQAALLQMFALAKSGHVARVMTYKAILAEKAGHPEQGLAIRHALMRCGSLMRAQGSSAIDALIGASITQIALARPGGVSYHNAPMPQDYDESLRWRQYTYYLSHIHHADEARWVNGVYTRQHLARQIIVNNSESAIETPLQRLLTWWTVDTLLLANLLILLFLGAALQIVRSRPRRFLPRAFLVISVTGACVGLAFWLTRGDVLLHQLAMAGDLVTLLNGTESPPISSVALWTWACFALVVPILTLLTAAFAGRVRHVPFTTRFCALLAPTACLVTFIYGGSVVGTLQQEHRVSVGLSRAVQHAGPYLAQFSAQTWPNATP